MKNTNTYDVLIIGGGISACVFASNYLKNNFRSKIAIIEAGRRLGGRASTRNSKRFKGWKLNHGSPNLNIFNRNNNESMQNFIDELLKNKIIKIDDSDLIQLGSDLKLDSIKNSDFSFGNNYNSFTSMTELSQNIVSLNNLRNQIDFYFGTLIIDMKFSENEWALTSVKGDKFISKFIVCSSNLLLHKRSILILNINQIPLRKAIPKNQDKKIDSLLNILNQQLYIPRLVFLIYTKKNYRYKDEYSKKYRYFYLKKDLENKFKFERVIFQLQNNNKLGIVIHTRSKEFIEEYLKNKKEDKVKEKILTLFNDLFQHNSCINQLLGSEEISIMSWRASQPFGLAVPFSLQFSSKYKIGFCGDWFEGEGFGRIEGAILSALKLADKFKSIN